MEKIIILGSGIAGLTAAIYAARDALEPAVVCGPLPGGLLTRTDSIENFPGFPDGISGADLVERMIKQAQRFGAKMIYASAVSVDLKRNDGLHAVALDDGRELTARAVIAATGSEPRMLHLPGEEKFIGRGISVCATCDGAFYRGRVTAVIGGGDSAATEALDLARMARTVHLIHRGERLTAGKLLAERVAQTPEIVLHPESEVIAYLGNDVLNGIRIRTADTGKSRETDLACDGVFPALGHVPETKLFSGQTALADAGCILTEKPFSTTGIDGFFAAGDCADCVYRQAVTAAGTGCCAALDARRYLTEE